MALSRISILSPSSADQVPKGVAAAVAGFGIAGLSDWLASPVTAPGTSKGWGLGASDLVSPAPPLILAPRPRLGAAFRVKVVGRSRSPPETVMESPSILKA